MSHKSKKNPFHALHDKGEQMEIKSKDSVEEKETSPKSMQSLRDEMEKLKEELKDAQEKVVRAHAEMENVRRRTSGDIEKAHKYGIEKFAEELLPVVDSLEKALESHKNAAPNLSEGVELTLQMFLNALEKHGVVQIDPLNQPFNPQLHEAMSIQPNADVKSGTVIAVMQKGYELNGRLIRPAMVVVSQ